MKQAFNLFYDTKETIWYRQRYTVQAESAAEAAALLQASVGSFFEEDNPIITMGDGDYLLDTKSTMLISQNDMEATEIILLQPTSSVGTPTELWNNEPVITPVDYEGPTLELDLYYRDGANYKYNQRFTVARSKVHAAIAKHGPAFYDQDDAQIQYDYDLGISREDFHGTLGTVYEDAYDHNFVIIESIDGEPTSLYTLPDNGE